MEYIPSVEIRPYFDKFVRPHPERVDRFVSLCFPDSVIVYDIDPFILPLQLAAFLSTYVELHKHDVAQTDIALRNILLLPPIDNEYRFVVVDFTIASSIRYFEKLELDWLCNEVDGLEGCFEDELEIEFWADWRDSDKGRALWNLVAKGPDELAVLLSSAQSFNSKKAGVSTSQDFSDCALASTTSTTVQDTPEHDASGKYSTTSTTESTKRNDSTPSQCPDGLHTLHLEATASKISEIPRLEAASPSEQQRDVHSLQSGDSGSNDCAEPGTLQSAGA